MYYVAHIDKSVSETVLTIVDTVDPTICHFAEHDSAKPSQMLYQWVVNNKSPHMFFGWKTARKVGGKLSPLAGSEIIGSYMITIDHQSGEGLASETYYIISWSGVCSVPY